MANIRLVFLWHMHQPFYKDLVTGQYRLPWVRLHALKDYYGMVKLLDEFPDVHQTFNLVPSLIAQIEDYVSGKARDPFLEVAAMPARDLSQEERRFALAYLFQANPVHLIARYPRYEELYLRFRGAGESPERALPRFEIQDFADLQVLAQIAWFDEFFLDEPEVAALVRKGKGFSTEDQRAVIRLQQELMSRVLPAYADAAKKGSIEISTSPYYHPILPLLCDSEAGAVSSPGLRLPQRRFQHPEDARTQLERGLELHERVFGVRPCGAWPSEGSVSEQALHIASELGLEWMATDEGVLARSTSQPFGRNSNGIPDHRSAERLYRIYRYEASDCQIHLLFRDHVLSDLIGFVYSGMSPKEAAENFIHRIRESTEPLISQGRDAVVPVILDGENAWEYYPQSGREFLRRLYDGFQRDERIQAMSVAEAIRAEGGTATTETRRTVAVAREAQDISMAALPMQCSPVVSSRASVEIAIPDRRRFVRLANLIPGSWINANFNIWIGAPEDNRSWDYLMAARDYYANYGMTATAEQRALAFEEILIAEGSDWNWWYGPEHHSANDRDFDELYRKHLSNIYLALGARPPDYLAQPIAITAVRPTFVPQTAYIHPRIGADYERYFDWIGASMYSADRRAGAMHGKQFLLDSVYAGVDEGNLYGRLDFATMPEEDFEVRVSLECMPPKGSTSAVAVTQASTLEVTVAKRAIQSWRMRAPDGPTILNTEALREHGALVSLRRNFTFQLPLSELACLAGSTLRLRFGLWRDRLPLDALPLEGWIELRLESEDELQQGLYNYSASS
jgi:alpha-amylase/alpha-mannosidase (GH57 family)